MSQLRWVGLIGTAAGHRGQTLAFISCVVSFFFSPFCSFLSCVLSLSFTLILLWWCALPAGERGTMPVEHLYVIPTSVNGCGRSHDLVLSKQGFFSECRSWYIQAMRTSGKDERSQDSLVRGRDGEMRESMQCTVCPGGEASLFLQSACCCQQA